MDAPLTPNPTRPHLVIFFSGGHGPATFDRICSGLRPPHSVQHDLDLLALVATLGKPGAKVTICQAVTDQVLVNELNWHSKQNIYQT